MDIKSDLKRKRRPSSQVIQRIPDRVLEIIDQIPVNQKLGAVVPVERVFVKAIDVVYKLIDVNQLGSEIGVADHT